MKTLELETGSEVETPPTMAQLLPGILNRLAFPVVAFVLVFWNLIFFLNSWVLMPANDFGRIHASALQFVQGEDMYAWMKGTPAWLESDYKIDLYNMNPPHLHVLFLPFTLVPTDYAFALWWVVSGFCLFFCLRWILTETGLVVTDDRRRMAVLFFLGFNGTAAMLYTGQISFLLLVPLTLMWRAARHGKWSQAGLWLGLAVSVKPFLAVLLAYFLWRGRWRALASSLGAVACCFLVGLIVFGWQNHVSWHEKLTLSKGWAWLPLNASLMGALAHTFTDSIWYMPLANWSATTVGLLWLGIGGVFGIITLKATGRGDSPESVDQDFALLLFASVFFCPLGWIYYYWLALPPLLGLMSRGWPFYTKTNDGEAATGSESRLTPKLGQGRALILLVVMMILFWPTTQTRLMQPRYYHAGVRHWFVQVDRTVFQPVSLATLTIGNIYFWGLLTIWGSLVYSGLALKRRLAAENEFALTPLDPSAYRISVVMPVFSETDSVRQITGWLTDKLGPRLEEIIIVQSPRSSEASRQVCNDLCTSHPHVKLTIQQENPGLGNAVRQGLELTTGNVVLMIDSDGEMEIETVPRMIAEMARTGCGMVVASRWLPGGGFSGYSKFKYYLNGVFQTFFRWIFWTRLHDLTYGFKLMRAELARGIHWKGTLHEVACETTLRPVALGVPVTEVPSKWTARTQGVSKNSFWRNFRYVRMAAGILLRGVKVTPPAKRGEQQTVDTVPVLNL